MQTQTRAYLFELAVATALLSASAYLLMKRHEGGGGVRGGKAFTAFTPFYTQVYLYAHTAHVPCHANTTGPPRLLRVWVLVGVLALWVWSGRSTRR